MRCPACEAENTPEAKQCKACGARLGKPSRRREQTLPPDPWSGTGLDNLAYRLAFYALLPGPSLVLAPVSLACALVAWRRFKRRGEPTPPSLLFTLLLSAALIVTQTVGLTLMVLALQS